MNDHRVLSLLFFLVLGITSPTALANGFAMFSKHEELKAHVIIDAGDFEKVDPPFGTLGATETVKLNSNCFKPFGSLGLWGKKAGFILVDRNKAIRIAILESSIGSIKVESFAAMQVACPTKDSDGLPVDPQERLKELQLQLERLRQQQKTR